MNSHEMKSMECQKNREAFAALIWYSGIILWILQMISLSKGHSQEPVEGSYRLKLEYLGLSWKYLF